LKKFLGFIAVALIVVGVLNSLESYNHPTATSAPVIKNEVTQPKQQSDGRIDAKDYAIGEKVAADKLVYTINKVETTQKIGNKTSEGKFVIVNASVLNNDKEPRMITSTVFEITDEKDRKFRTTDDMNVAFKVGDTIMYKDLNPGLSKTGNIVFEVPADATRLKLKVASGVLLAGGQYQVIDLGELK
jgi:hypothetical protein